MRAGWRRRLPARRSISARRRATWCSSRRPIPSSPASRRPRRGGRRAARACGSPTCLQLGHPLSVDLYVEQVVAQRAARRRAPARRPQLLALRARAGGGGLPRGQGPARGAAGRRPARPRARRLVEPAARGLPSAVAVRRPGRARQCAEPAGLRREPARPGRALARAGALAARRALLAGARPPDPRRSAPRLAARPAARGAGVLPRAGPGRRPRRDRRADRGAATRPASTPLPIFTASLKDPVAAPLVRHLLAETRPHGRPERHRLCGLEPRRSGARRRSTSRAARCCSWCSPAAARAPGATARAACRRAIWR